MPDNLDELRHTEGFPIGEDEDFAAPDRRLTRVPDLTLAGMAVVGSS
jgi:hypothetical protein